MGKASRSAERLGTGHTWRCSVCKRTFAKRNQAHSCQVSTVAAHFQGKDPQLRLIFDEICRAVERTGPLRVDAAKTTIHLVSLHHFGGVNVRKDSLRVGFMSNRALRSPRLTGEERLGSNRFAYHVTVRSLADIDDELVSWLAAAQEMQARGRDGKRGLSARA
jgi:hypothetical protein